MNALQNFISKYSAVKYIMIWFVALAIGLGFRLYPLIMYSSDDSREKATILVIGQIQNQLARQLSGSPYNEEQREAIISKQLNQILQTDTHMFEAKVDELSKVIDTQGAKRNDYPYLLASDSFYYYHLTENIVNTGTISDTVKGSKYLNELMLTPSGHWEPLNLHPYIGFFVYKIITLFNADFPLMYAVSFTPLIITALALLPYLFLCASLKYRAIPTFVGSVFFLLAPIFIKRSTFGWYDNDPYNVFFPMAILTMLFVGLDLSRGNNKRQAIIAGICTALLIMLYSFFWHGWMLLFGIILAGGILIALLNHFIFKQKHDTQNISLLFGTTILISFISISMAFGFGEFFVLFKEGWVALENFLTPQLALWPDLYLSVGELKSGSFRYIILFTGGRICFAMAMIGLIYALSEIFNPKQRTDYRKTIIIAMFLLASIIITLGAQRFAMLCLTPIAIFFPLGLQKCMDGLQFLSEKITRSSVLRISARVMISLAAICLILMPINTMKLGIKRLLNPIFNETWEDTLIQLRDSSPENSIVYTWWPPGHFIKSIAHRRVIFDGATINYPQSYWMANVLISQSEEEALGIMRMVNNSGNGAAEYLHEIGQPISKAVQLLDGITLLDHYSAGIITQKILKDYDQTKHLLSLTHQKPDPTYLLLYNEMVENNIQLGFISNWNFERIEEINANPELLETVPKRNSKEYMQFLWDMVGGPYKFSEPLTQLKRQGNFILFQSNVQVNLDKKECRVISEKFGKGVPLSMFYLDGETNKVVEIKQEKSTLPYSVVLHKSQDKYIAHLMDRRMAQSLLVKLFFFDGHGLKYFKPFSNKSDLTDRTIIKVFEVNWEAFLQDIEEKGFKSFL